MITRFKEKTFNYKMMVKVRPVSNDGNVQNSNFFTLNTLRYLASLLICFSLLIYATQICTAKFFSKATGSVDQYVDTHEAM